MQDYGASFFCLEKLANEGRVEPGDGGALPRRDARAVPQDPERAGSALKRHVYDILAKAFMQEGVRTCFALLGDANMNWAARWPSRDAA